MLRNAAANGTITVDGKAVDFAYVGNDAVIPRSSLSDVCQVRIVADNGNGGYQTAAVWYNKEMCIRDRGRAWARFDDFAKTAPPCRGRTRAARGLAVGARLPEG